MPEKSVVIIFEDDIDCFHLLNDKLKKEIPGIVVFFYFNYQLLFEAIQKYSPDVIIMDVMMPEGEMNGYQACKKVKEDDRYSDIPVLLLTAVADHISSTRYSHQSGKETEADGYIPKGPEALDEVVVEVKRLIRK